MKSYVIGAGSIGLFLQYLLQQSGDSTLILRKPSWDKLKDGKLEISGVRQAQAEINCRLFEEALPIAEDATIFIATKAHEVEPLIATLKPHLSKTNAIVLCQNGIGIETIGKKLLPENPVYRAFFWMGIRRIALDHIHVAGIHKLVFAGDDKNFLSHWQKRIADLGVTCEVEANTRLCEWQKALWNITVNGLCAIVDEPNGSILKYDPLRFLAASIMNEAVWVAKLDGIQLSDADCALVFQSIEKTKENINATLQDLQAGRHPELEFLNGAVVNIAKDHDQKAPLNETIFNIVSFLEKTQVHKGACHVYNS